MDRRALTSRSEHFGIQIRIKGVMQKNVLGPAFALVAFALALASFGTYGASTSVLLLTPLLAGVVGHILGRLPPGMRAVVFFPLLTASDAVVQWSRQGFFTALALGAVALPTLVISLRDRARSVWSVAVATFVVCIAFGVRSALDDVAPRDAVAWESNRHAVLVASTIGALVLASIVWREARALRDELREEEEDPLPPPVGAPYRVPVEKKSADRSRFAKARTNAISAAIAFVSLVAAAIAVAHVALAAAPRIRVDAPIVEVAPPTPASPIHVVHTSDAMAELVQSDQTWTYAHIAGIDRAHHRAILAISKSGPHPAFSYDVVDYVTGERVERWAATEENARNIRGSWFRPISGTLEEDLAHAARLADTLDEKRLDGSYDIVVSPDARYAIFDAGPTDGHDGDWLWVVDRKLGSKHRIRDDERAGYAPAFSPDGRRIAWYGCTVHGCDYGVYVSLVDGKPHRLVDGNAYSGPYWTTSTSIVFTQQTGSDERWSFHAVDVVHGTDHVIASTDMRSLTIDLAPDAGSLVLSGSIGMAPPDKNASGRSWGVYRWLKSPFTKTSAEYVTDRGCILVSDDGKLFCERSSFQDPGEVSTFDMTNNDEHIMPSDGYLSSPTRIDDDSVLAIREHIHAPIELVRIDLKMIRASRPKLYR
jgi:hypothetical protein